MHSVTWIEEPHENFFSSKFRLKRTLFSEESPYQTVDVVETTGHGKMLLNDGLIMITERDEFIYHDMISHVPLFAHKNPKKVLIIGGGDGGTAREVLRHKSIESCTMVEIDKVVVDACRKYIPQTSCALNHEKLNLLIEDGIKFVKDTDEKFDVIIVDSTNPIGPAVPLFGEEFYQDVKRCLTEDGIVVSQAECAHFTPVQQKQLYGILKSVFPNLFLYNYTNLTYPGFMYSFSFASVNTLPFENLSELRIKESGIDFQYYNYDIHKAAFALPTFQKRYLEI